MIARIWHGMVPKDKADEYYTVLEKTGLKDYRNTKGILDVKVLRRDEGRRTHYLLITYWNSYESIRQFAGEEYEKARYYPEDEKYLLEFEPFVNHYQMVEDTLL